MQWVSGLQELLVLVALGLGATLAKWLLEALITVTDELRRIFPGLPRSPALPALLFMGLLVGAPAVTVAWAFATGRLPVPH
jgi:hypothetical protein